MKRSGMNKSLKYTKSFELFDFITILIKSPGRFLFMSMIAFSISLASCEKDDDDDDYEIPKENHLMYDSKRYEITAGILEYYGQWWKGSNGFNFDISLFSSGIFFDEEIDDLSGQGNLITFEMFSSSETELMPGIYNFDADESYKPGTFDWGLFVINYDIEDQTGEISGEIESGTVKVEKSGSLYRITIDCRDNQGKRLTGYFEGNLDFYDWSDFWKNDPSIN